MACAYNNRVHILLIAVTASNQEAWGIGLTVENGANRVDARSGVRVIFERSD